MQPGRVQGAGAGDKNRWSEGPPLPRWVLWLMLPGILGPLVILGFIVVTESAHDAKRCPYREVERRSVAPAVVVLEEARNCVGATEERRYSLLRDGAEPRVLGERRFDKSAFAHGYRWTAVVSQEREVQVTVHNDGHDDLTLREGTPEERAKGVSH